MIPLDGCYKYFHIVIIDATNFVIFPVFLNFGVDHPTLASSSDIRGLHINFYMYFEYNHSRENLEIFIPCHAVFSVVHMLDPFLVFFTRCMG